MRRWAYHLTAVQAAAIAVTLAVTPTPVQAQSQEPLGGLTAPKVDSNLPMLLQADEMIYDNQNNKVTARGNVEIYYSNYTLLANKVIYDQRLNTLAAEGDVRIKEPDGAVINADRITLTDDFREGFIPLVEDRHQRRCPHRRGPGHPRRWRDHRLRSCRLHAL